MKKFEESQRLIRNWMNVIYIPIGGLLLLFLFADYTQIILDKPFGDKPATNAVLIIISLFLIVVIIIFEATTLVTCIDEQGIKYKWKPLQRKYSTIKWNDIMGYDIIRSKGLHYGYSKNKMEAIHYLGSDYVIEIKLTNGKTIILGTNKANEIRNFILAITPTPTF